MRSSGTRCLRYIGPGLITGTLGSVATFYPICNLGTLAVLLYSAKAGPPRFQRVLNLMSLLLCLLAGRLLGLARVTILQNDSVVGVIQTTFTQSLLLCTIYTLSILAAEPTSHDHVHDVSLLGDISRLMTFPTIWSLSAVLVERFVPYHIRPVCAELLFSLPFVSGWPGRLLQGILSQSLVSCIELIRDRPKLCSAMVGSWQPVSTSTLTKMASKMPATLKLAVLASFVCGICIALQSHEPGLYLTLSCADSANIRDTGSALQAVLQQVAKSHHIVVSPESSRFTHSKLELTAFKDDILKAILPPKGKNISDYPEVIPSSVVLPATYYGARSCTNQLHLQSYALGEPRMTYVYARKGHGQPPETSSYGSTFLSFPTKHLVNRNFLVLVAICLDSDFPNDVFPDQSPKVIIIPNSSWSREMPREEHVRMERMRYLAVRKKTAILFCGGDRVGYIDRTGRVEEGASHAFEWHYNLKTDGRISVKFGEGLTPWWALPLLVFLLHRISSSVSFKQWMSSKRNPHDV